MAGLGPAIHVFGVLKIVREGVDARHKAGHDGGEAVRSNSSRPDLKPSLVMAGLVPAIHVFIVARPQDVDARDIGVRKHAVPWTAMRGHDAHCPALHPPAALS
jgi:hypothetical protein